MRNRRMDDAVNAGHMTNKMAAPLARLGVRTVSTGFRCLSVNRRSSSLSIICSKTFPFTSNALCKCNVRFRVGITSQRCHNTRSDRKCWKCDAKTNEIAELFFCNCGVVQKVPTDLSLFDAMECEESFNIDVAKLPDLYKERQRNLHPDKFAQKSKV